MRVVLDTNIMQQDTTLSGHAWRVFIDSHIGAGHKLYVPRVAYDELLANHRRGLVEAKTVMQGALNKFAGRTGHRIPNPLSEEEVGRLYDEYKANLDTQLTNAQAVMLEYPSVTHEKMAQREMQRRKPTKASGEGYRDGLIWESILELAQTVDGESIAFISANSTDFAGNESELHSDLVEELSKLEPGSASVVLFGDLGSFNDKQIKPTLEVLSGIAERLSTNEYASLNLESYLTNHLVDGIQYNLFSPEELELPALFQEIELTRVSDSSELRNIDVRGLAPHLITVSFRAGCRCQFVFQFRHDAYELLSEAAKKAINKIELSDELYVGSIILSVLLEVSLTFDESVSGVLAADITRIQVTDRKQWLRDMPQMEPLAPVPNDALAVVDLINQWYSSDKSTQYNDYLQRAAKNMSPQTARLLLKALRQAAAQPQQVLDLDEADAEPDQ